MTKSLKKIKLSIGIPAFNEQYNIAYLINDLLSQNKKYYKLQEIIVITDGCTDRTVKEILKIKSTLVRVIIGENRLGQQARQNQLLDVFKGDFLAIIEADCLPKNKTSTDNLVEPLYKDKRIGLIVGQANYLEPKSILESSVYHGNNLKSQVVRQWKKGFNIYTIGGHCAKVISRDFASKVTWPDTAPEDAYVYLKAKQLRVKIIKSGNAVFIKKNVSTLKDRLRQSAKFISGRRSLSNHFDKAVIDSEYNIDKLLIFKCTLYHLIKNPLLIPIYLVNTAVNRLLTINKKQFNHLYQIYYSSKNLKGI